jgi:hypothetical protein
VVAAAVDSTQLNGFLTLTDSAGDYVRSDDNSYGFNDPFIVQYLKAGTYQLMARDASSTAGGTYLVTVAATAGARPPFCSSLGQLAMNATISATLSYASCQFIDNTFADVYQITLASPTAIDLRMNSGDFDAYLTLWDAKGNLVAQDDDSGGGTNARIQQSLAAGTYYVFAKQFGNYYPVGNYTVALAQSQSQ